MKDIHTKTLDIKQKTMDTGYKTYVFYPKVSLKMLLTLFIVHYSLFICLLAQQLRLPTEDIVGQISDRSDSLSISKDLYEYMIVDDAERLQYRTVYEKEIDLLQTSKQNGYLYLKGGSGFSDNEFRGQGQFGVYSRTAPFLNLHTKGLYTEQDSFKTTRAELAWKPLTYLSDFRVRPEVFAKYSKYESDIAAISSSEMKGGGFTLGAYPTDYPTVKYLRFSGEFLSLKQSKSDEKPTNDDFELDINTHLGDIGFISESKLDWYYRYGSGHFAGNIYFPIPFLNTLALHLQYSDDLWPSLLIEKSFFIDPKIEFAFSNFPYIQANSIWERHNYYAYAPLDKPRRDLRYAEQVPLNAFFALNLYMPLETRMYVNSRYIQNYHFIDNVASWQYADALINSANLEIMFLKKPFSFGINGKFQLSDLTTLKHPTDDDKKIKVPYIPHLQFTPWASFTYKKFTSKVKGDILLERYSLAFNNDKQQKIDDKDILCLVSNENTFDINRHFKVGINLYNILNQEYYHIPGLPKEGFSAELSLRVLF